MSEITADEKIKSAVRETYGGIARRFVEEPAATRAASCCGPSTTTVEETPAQSAGCCGPSAAKAEDVPTQAAGCCDSSESSAGTTNAAGRLYGQEELADLPDSVTDAALGCGNPTAIAGLQPGEVVLDLGSGGGIDCFLAAKKVGPTGRVIGLDMTPDMIKLARHNAKKMGVTNAEFRYGEMEEIPLPDESVDVIISNCVINLSPDKDAVFREAYRVLRPGGRMSVSDMVVDGDLPPAIRSRLDAWAGCIAGALDERVYLDKIRAAGFERVEVASRDYASSDQLDEVDDSQIIAVGADGQDAKELLQKAGLSARDLAQRVASIKVTAFKPV